MRVHKLLAFMNKIFEIKDISYDLRGLNILFQPKCSKLTYGKNIQVLWCTYLELASYYIKNSTTIENKLLLKAVLSIHNVYCFILSIKSSGKDPNVNYNV